MFDLILINILCYSEFHSVDCAVSILPQLVDASGGNTKFDPRIVGGAKAHEGQVRGIVSAIDFQVFFGRI